MRNESVKSCGLRGGLSMKTIDEVFWCSSSFTRAGCVTARADFRGRMLELK